jgi:4-hydroxy-tetrahydrodipicolinate synthase
MRLNWRGVIPAVTTPFNEDLSVDHGFLAEHVRRLVESGCVGIVPIGSLGEAATLTLAEKRQVLETCVRAVGERVPVIAGISALATAEAVELARDARRIGCRGLMVLPPYVYSTDWREMRAHVAAVIGADDLPCMLYNNPVAYRTDFTPEQIAELAAGFPNLEAVKESSTDLRRVTAIRALLGDRLDVLVGVDDAIVEGLDADQDKVGRGSARVRPPRLRLEGEELRLALATIEHALRTRPRLPG